MLAKLVSLSVDSNHSGYGFACLCNVGSIKNSPWYSPLHLYGANDCQLCLGRHHSKP